MHGASMASAGRYASAIAVMTEMGWSWRELCESPADLVQEVLAHLYYRQKWTDQKRMLDAYRK